MSYDPEVKKIAQQLDAECFESYSGKVKQFKEDMDVRRINALLSAQSIVNTVKLEGVIASGILYYFAVRVENLITDARRAGVIVSIDIVSPPPLAMGNVKMVASVRKARVAALPRSIPIEDAPVAPTPGISAMPPFPTQWPDDEDDVDWITAPRSQP